MPGLKYGQNLHNLPQNLTVCCFVSFRFVAVHFYVQYEIGFETRNASSGQANACIVFDHIDNTYTAA